jgi:hypothetical protein
MEKAKTKVISSVKFGTGLLLFLLAFAFHVHAANGASISFSPSSGSFDVGSTFSVRVLVSSPGVSMNAVSGVVSFPSDKISVISVSKTNSIVNLWVQDPSFSNVQGTVNFEGIVLNPGFAGSNGQVITITFRTTAPGISLLSFLSGSVLANDGSGTNILDPDGLGSAQFAINVPPVGANNNNGSEETTPTTLSGPLAPSINSPTHPDSNSWYSDNNPKFTWDVPQNVTAVRILYDRFPRSLPNVLYQPAIGEKDLSSIADGVWYLHAQFRDASGWGSVAHFRFQIDTVSPEKYDLALSDGGDPTNPSPTVTFNTTDSLSGLDHYRLKIDNGDFVILNNPPIGGETYTPSAQEPGRHTIWVQAFDKAGNYRTAVSEFTIASLKPPVITDYPKTIANGETPIIKGTTQYPGADIVFWFQRDSEPPINLSTQSDGSGSFTLVVNQDLGNGAYNFWAQAIDKRGAKSDLTEKMAFIVGKSSFFSIGTFAVDFLSVVVPLIILIIALALVLWFGWRRWSGLHKKVKKEMRGMEQDLHKSFDVLRSSILGHIRTLEKAKNKRELTEEEDKILTQLKRDLDRAEQNIEGEMEKIEKDIK